MKVREFFGAKAPAACKIPEDRQQALYKRLSLSSFVGITVAYSLFYVCRMSLSVVKQPLIDTGTFSATQVGAIGSAMLLVYAVGKFVNGFISDYCNLRRCVAAGLAVSTLVNFAFGISGLVGIKGAGTTAFFLFFAVLWALNGWVLSIGASSGVVNLSRWMSKSRRATFYSIFSTTPYVGQFLSFLVLGFLVEKLGWESGFLFASAAGAAGVLLTLLMVHDSPESEGLPTVGEMFGESETKVDKKAVRDMQAWVFRNPGIWLVALSAALVYIAKYGVTDWGVLFLQKTRGFTLSQASQMIGFSTVPGVIGTLAAGWLSDRLFKGDRARPALLSGLLSAVFLGLFLFTDGGYVASAVYAALFNLFISILFCIVAGFMVLDIVPRHATGAASGIIGISCYVAAGLQELLSGMILDSSKLVDDIPGVGYDFTVASFFWLLASVLAFVLPVAMWDKMRGWLNEAE
ncbi:MAG: MFS transporter [Bacteroidales bacterium]|nr:MFS transporter [Bacteroidales bacterium]